MLFTPLLSEAELLDVIPFKGVPEFKQVQMYKNFRQFLPPEFQNITCPKPSDDVLKRQKDDQKQRVQNKKRKILLGAPPEEQHHQPENAEQQEYQDCGIQSI